jgi:hypothetical protein
MLMPRIARYANSPIFYPIKLLLNLDGDPLLCAIALFFLRDTSVSYVLVTFSVLFSFVKVWSVARYDLPEIRYYFSTIVKFSDEEIKELTEQSKSIYNSTETVHDVRYKIKGQLLLPIYWLVAYHFGMDFIAVPCLVWSEQLYIWASEVVPPLALFIGATSLESAQLCAELDKRITPLKTVHLLNPGPMLVNIYPRLLRTGWDETGLQAVYRNDVRLRGGGDWERVVADLARCAPVIIADIRELSDPLRQELRILIDQALLYKTIFVVESLEDGISKITEYVSARAPEYAILTASELPRNIIYYCIILGSLPKRDATASKIFLQPVPDHKSWGIFGCE